MGVNIVELEVLAVELAGTIRGGIIDEDYFIGCVVLGENGVKVVLESELSIIVVTWNDHTHRKLGGYRA